MGKKSSFWKKKYADLEKTRITEPENAVEALKKELLVIQNTHKALKMHWETRNSSLQEEMLQLRVELQHQKEISCKQKEKESNATSAVVNEDTLTSDKCNKVTSSASNDCVAQNQEHIRRMEKE